MTSVLYKVYNVFSRTNNQSVVIVRLFRNISVILDHLGCVMISMLSLNADDHEFYPCSCVTNIDHENGICKFSTEYTAERSQCKD